MWGVLKFCGKPHMKKKLFDKLVKLGNELIEIPVGNAKHFTFIVCRHKILSIGFNNAWKTTPQAKKFGHRFSAIHSEVDAIKRFPYPVSRLADCDIINIRFKKDMTLGLSKPCAICQNFLAQFNIGQLWYSVENGFERFI